MAIYSYYYGDEEKEMISYFQKKSKKEKRSLAFYITESLKNLFKKEKRNAKQTKH